MDAIAAAAAEAIRAEELTALSSIYGEQMSMAGKRHFVVEIELSLDPPAKSTTEVHVLLPPPRTISASTTEAERSDDTTFFSTYPYEPPPLLVVNDTLAPSVARAINDALWLAAREQLSPGEPVIFDVLNWLQEPACTIARDAQARLIKAQQTTKQTVPKGRGIGFGKATRAKERPKVSVEEQFADQTQHRDGKQIGRRQRRKIKQQERSYDRLANKHERGGQSVLSVDNSSIKPGILMKLSEAERAQSRADMQQKVDLAVAAELGFDEAEIKQSGKMSAHHSILKAKSQPTTTKMTKISSVLRKSAQEQKTPLRSRTKRL